jgi:EmrB/QacA subfamily drug resistance transporter
MSDTDVLAIPTHHAAQSVRRWFALPVILAGTFMVTLDFFIVNVAIPSIQRDLSADTAAIEWLVAGYGLAYAALLITGGRLGDLYGRRRMFCVGLAAFTLASAACGLAPGAGWLVSARVAQGAGAALLAPQVLAILGTIYQGADRARAFVAYGVVLGLASACGQVIGGLLIQLDWLGLGWRGCFLVNVPVGIGAMLLAPVTVPTARPVAVPTARPVAVPKARPVASSGLDIAGAGLVTLAIASLLLPLIEGRAHGWPIWTWLCFAAAAALSATFVLQQRHRARGCSAPLVDPVLFQDPRFSTGLLAALTLFGGVASSFFVLALYLQQGRGLAPLPSGLVFSTLALAFTVTSLSAARIGRWLGRPTLVTGAVGMAIGLATLAATVEQIGTGGSVVWLVGPLLVDGAGMGLVMAPLAATVLAGLPAHHAAAAAGVLVTAQQLANALGVALVGLVYFGVLRHGGSAGAFTASFACLAALALALAGLALRLERA